jgi:hypothetical protein
MAIGWLSALKAVPWQEVLTAAPMISEHARKLLNRTQERGDRVAENSVESATQALENRVAKIESTLNSNSVEAASVAQLVNQLAGQAESMARTVHMLRIGVLALGAGVLLSIILSIGCLVVLTRGQ